MVDGIKARRPAYKERICQESQSLIFGGNGAQIVKWSLIIHRLPVGLAPKRIYRHGDAAHRQSGAAAAPREGVRGGAGGGRGRRREGDAAV